MEYFYGGGGNNNPDFNYRFWVKDVTSEMHHWCNAYPLSGPFERWHIKPQRANSNGPIIQFESRKAAYMFRLAFSEYILEDITWSFLRKEDGTW